MNLNAARDPVAINNLYERHLSLIKTGVFVFFILRVPILLGASIIYSKQSADMLDCNPHLFSLMAFFIIPWFIVRWIILCSIKSSSLVTIEKAHMLTVCLESITAMLLLFLEQRGTIDEP